uniref:Ribosomal RNA methyltransferase FtsJ domain-containing protein n=1 Tax=Aegilops tauschii subsp. strangulata TaxID=200361 RepID=A0A453SRJ2_AEGTS
AGNNGKQRPQDKFDLLAKEQGYRSRAAFKLLQLDTLFRLLPTARAVLDLCAAPGGWVQVAVSRAAPGPFVVGVDLAPIRPIRGALSLKEDITASARCGAAVRRLMDSRGVSSFEVVLHDGCIGCAGGHNHAVGACHGRRAPSYHVPRPQWHLHHQVLQV